MTREQQINVCFLSLRVCSPSRSVWGPANKTVLPTIRQQSHTPIKPIKKKTDMPTGKSNLDNYSFSL